MDDCNEQRLLSPARCREIMMPWGNENCVVVPVDFSESTPDAVRKAVEIAAEPQDVHIVYVVPELDFVSPGVVFGNVTDESRVTAAKKFMHEYLQKHSLPDVQTHVLMGDPGTTAVKFATKQNADLIVIPSHGYHGVKHLLLGSVAERIIRHANCAVLVLRRHDAE